MRNSRGITIISLIITIVIMIILVSVAMNYALNGGIITKAKEAREKTQKAAEREELFFEVIGTLDYNGELDLPNLTLNGWTKSSAKQDSNNNTYYEFTSPKRNVFYVYPDTGIIVENEPTGGTESEVQEITFYLAGDSSNSIRITLKSDGSAIFILDDFNQDEVIDNNDAANCPYSIDTNNSEIIVNMADFFNTQIGTDYYSNVLFSFGHYTKENNELLISKRVIFIDMNGEDVDEQNGAIFAINTNGIVMEDSSLLGNRYIKDENNRIQFIDSGMQWNTEAGISSTEYYFIMDEKLYGYPYIPYLEIVRDGNNNIIKLVDGEDEYILEE